jgi:aldehyde:ferredoxin oxidoreductase
MMEDNMTTIDTNSVIQGKVLKINLSSGKIEIDTPSKSIYRKYFGGRGLAAYYLFKELIPKIDPLGPENVLAIFAGTLNGIPATGIPKFSIAAKSPLTEGIGESEAGGFWGPALRFCGFDGLVIKGKSEKPVYLLIQDQIISIESAENLMDKDTKEFQDVIRNKFPRSRVLQIGPAGVNGVHFANIVNELSYFNGRNGLGAVMGSKNLRAVVLNPGKKKLDLPNSEPIKQIAREISQNVKTNSLAAALHKVGTAGGIVPLNEGGALPTRNWTESYFDKAEQIGGEKLNNDYVIKRDGCFACSIRCKRVIEIDNETMPVNSSFGGPEYESIAGFGSLCMIEDLAVVCKANELCNRYAMDSMSTGSTIAFAMECYENGLITKKEIGYELNFGNAEALLKMINDICFRIGFGKILAKGSYRAAEIIGKGAEKFCHHVKKQEIPMHDPRVKTGMALQFAISPRGADHWVAQHDPYFTNDDSPGIIELAQIGIVEPVPNASFSNVKIRQFFYGYLLCGAYDILGVCTLAAVGRSVVKLEQILHLFEFAAGWKTSWFEILKASERVGNLVRLFNIREGIDGSTDTLPEIFLKDINNGPRTGTGAIKKEDFVQAVELFYRMSGWDHSGIPTKGKLEELGLEEFNLL